MYFSNMPTVVLFYGAGQCFISCELFVHCLTRHYLQDPACCAAYLEHTYGDTISAASAKS